MDIDKEKLKKELEKKYNEEKGVYEIRDKNKIYETVKID